MRNLLTLLKKCSRTIFTLQLMGLHTDQYCLRQRYARFSAHLCVYRSVSQLWFCFSGFRRNEEMKAMEVLPILKEKVAFLSGA